MRICIRVSLQCEKCGEIILIDLYNVKHACIRTDILVDEYIGLLACERMCMT